MDAMEEDPWAAQLALIHSVLNEKLAPYKQTLDDQKLGAIVDGVAAIIHPRVEGPAGR